MRQFFYNTWISGLRSRSLQAVFVLGLLLVGVAYLSSFFSARQPMTVALDVGLSMTRFSLVMLALFWVHEQVGREIDRRTVLFTITFPIPRQDYLLGRFFGILALLGVAVVILGLLLLAVVIFAAGSYQQQFEVALGGPYWASLFGIWLDAAVVTSFAFWIAALSTVPLLPLALGVAFAIAGRSFGAVRDYLAQGADGDRDLTNTFGPLIEVIQWVLPDLSRLDWRLWPMYAQPAALEPMLLGCLMALAYIVIMMGLAIRVFSRREFQ